MMRTTESIEHVVLRVLQQSGCLDVFTLSNIIFQTSVGSDVKFPTKSEINRVRRALSLLRQQGHVFRLGRAPVNGSSARPREVYADRKAAIAHASNLCLEFGPASLGNRPDLLALVETQKPASSRPSNVAAPAATGSVTG
jgi:hypothetical protein